MKNEEIISASGSCLSLKIVLKYVKTMSKYHRNLSIEGEIPPEYATGRTINEAKLARYCVSEKTKNVEISFASGSFILRDHVFMIKVIVEIPPTSLHWKGKPTEYATGQIINELAQWCVSEKWNYRKNTCQRFLYYWLLKTVNKLIILLQTRLG